MNTPCAKCGKESSKKCPSCNSVFYCGSQCMKAHRPEHKKVCRKLSKKKNPNKNASKVGGNVKYKGKELRFNIGDKVSCQVGMDEWQVGSIIQLLYKERGQTFPYQIMLNRDLSLISAPFDEDSCIKKTTEIHDLRFKAGDRVACLYGVWTHGTVINLWLYDSTVGIHQPYQVQLDDGTLIYAPVDLNGCIQQSIHGIDSKNTSSEPSDEEDSIDVKHKTYTAQLKDKGIVDVISEELRFNPGNRVECKVNETDHGVAWTQGVIIKLWYNHDPEIYPYQIRLDSKRLVYAPMDCDTYIRASDCDHPSELFVDENDPLFMDPQVEESDCPICLLPMDPELSIFQPCCSKTMCKGCLLAASNNGNGATLCPLCCTTGSREGKDILEQLNKSAETDPEAMITLAKFYKNGDQGQPFDYAKAFQLSKHAEELGLKDSYHQVGWHYWTGNGVDRGVNKAKHYFELSAKEGNLCGRENLAIIEFDEGNPWRGYKHYCIASKFGLTRGLKRVKQGYKEGFISKEDYTDVLRGHQKTILERSSSQRDEAVKQSAYDERARYTGEEWTAVEIWRSYRIR